MQPEQIVHVNAHATSTPAGDVVEAQAIAAALGDAAPGVVVSATKSMTGHLLGGAGAVESVAAILALRDRVAPPTINLEDPDDDAGLDDLGAATELAPRGDGRWPSSTTRSVSAAPTSRSPSPEPEPLPSLPSVPSVPPEQDAPVPPEEIDVTIVDSRTATQLRSHADNGGPRLAVVPALGMVGRGDRERAPSELRGGTGIGRDQRLVCLEQRRNRHLVTDLRASGELRRNLDR